MGTHWRNDKYITTWRQFWSVYKDGDCCLLNRLDDFPNSILIAGCQRSGTTVLSRIINASEGITTYWFGPDDELDAALILSGFVEHEPRGRYCFQTTYINDCYREYFKYKDRHKVIWLLRNPFSVIYSMLYNWNDESFNELYRSCGRKNVTGWDTWLLKLIGDAGISRLRKACWAYKEKISQIFELHDSFNDDSLMIVDYDNLVLNKDTVLPSIYRFLNLEYQDRYSYHIRKRSIEKSRNLSKKESKTIKQLCEADYLRARDLIPRSIT